MLVFASQSMLATAQKCDRFVNSRDSELQRFLQQRTSDQDPWCTVVALRTLGHHQVTGAISTLVDYLDFEAPMSEAEKNGIFIQPREPGKYPAETALFEIGKPALPALLDVIRSNTDSTSLKRANAIDAIMLIFREDNPSGVKLIRQAAESESDAKAAQSLHRAATEAVRGCVPEVKADCIAAAGEN
jgi:hypothetical protein